jgi:hypothetical protein
MICMKERGIYNGSINWKSRNKQDFAIMQRPTELWTLFPPKLQMNNNIQSVSLLYRSIHFSLFHFLIFRVSQSVI